MPWDSQDYGLLASALGATYADSATTKDLIKRGGIETNPLLGKKPSGQELDHAALVAGLLGTGVASQLSPEMRKRFLGAWAGLEGGLAYHNAHFNPKTQKLTGLDDAVRGGPLLLAALGMLSPNLTISPSDDGGKGVKISKEIKF